MAEQIINYVWTQEVLKNTPFMIDENPFERVGYEFAGWSEDKDARPEDAWDYDHFALQGINEELELYAIWKPVSLTFTFDPSGGKFSNGSEDIYARSDIQFGTFPSMDSGFLNPSRQGYTFDGWYDKNGGAKIDGWNFYATDNLDLVAKWTAVGGEPQEDIPQQPDHPETQPEDKKDEETQKVYNVISPEEDSRNKFHIVGETNPCAQKYIHLRFSGPTGGGLMYQAGQIPQTCNPYSMRVKTFVYECDQFSGEYYYKIDLAPGVDRASGSKSVVGKPSCPVWQKKDRRFLGWILRDQEGRNIAGQPSSDHFKNTNPKSTKPVYVNMRYTHSICVDGCWKQGFAFYAKIANF